MCSPRGRQFFVPAVTFLLILVPPLIGTDPSPRTPLPSGKRGRGQGDDVLKTLVAEHPRLLAQGQDWAALQKFVVKDELARNWRQRLQTEARRMLTEPPVEHKLIGPRLLDKSRTALRRISTLAALYRLDGDKTFAERACREMLTAAAFKDWNPSHFLDTAEMTTALALGYDWLYGYLSAEDRAAIRSALVEKGLKPGLAVYRKGSGWHKLTNNWNQVCNGGMAIGALAIADEEPELARTILTYAKTSIALAMASFAPDGGWAEGPGYWGYATRYNVLYLAAMQSGLGTDFDLGRLPGFDRTGDFRMHSIGPLGRTFNFADANDGAGTASQMLWLARTFDQPRYQVHECALATDRPEIFHLLWLSPNRPASVEPLPRDVLYRGIDTAFFRGSWDDPEALFVGFRGGDNAASHSHLDLGNFVMDALGQRWALDLGPDDYNLPGYFGKERWTYYRLRTEGHNTLTIDGENQALKARAPIIAFRSTPERAFAVADLSTAFGPKVTQARRGLAVLDRKSVLVVDEIQAAQPVAVVWNFHTKARIDIQGSRAILKQGKATLEARILSPKEASFSAVSANPPPPQAQQPGVSNLTIRLPEPVRQTRLSVLLTPAGVNVPAIPPASLDAWSAEGKLSH